MTIEDELCEEIEAGRKTGMRAVSIDLLQRALDTIEHLRSVAGAVSKGEDFRDIAAKAGRRERPISSK